MKRLPTALIIAKIAAYLFDLPSQDVDLPSQDVSRQACETRPCYQTSAALTFIHLRQW